ncbi:MAG: cytochrome c oxidase subunit II [Novosphingobium sp.]
MPVAIAIALLVVASVLFHIFSPWWQTPLASNWGAIDSALNITLWICGAVFVALNLFLAHTIWRYRNRPDHKAHYEPENPKLEKQLTLITAVGIIGMLAPGLWAWNQFITVPKDATIVEAVGQQWQWSFRYPGPDGVLGAAAVKHMTPENPLGLDPLDPFGRDDILAEGNELHLPAGQPVKLVLRSKDVLHNFYVSEFRAKMDLVPGIVTYFWMTPTIRGKFDVLCAELCGVGHHEMRASVVVDSTKNYQSWLAQQASFEQVMAQANPNSLAAILATSNACYAPAAWSNP